LIGSFAVTLLTQAVTSLANTRGRHLYRGLINILQQFDPTLDQKIAGEISDKILTNPLISDVSTRYGSIVSREELTTLLLQLAAGSGTQKLSQTASIALNQALKQKGVTDPDETLSNIRDLALRLEQSNPELANDVRNNMAILHTAPAAFVIKINAWFDQTMDRVSARFTTSTHAITLVLAIVTAVGVQMDTIAIVNRLYSNPALRQQLIQTAPNVLAIVSSQNASGGGTSTASAPTNSGPAADQAKTAANNVVVSVDNLLGQSGLFSAPKWQWTWFLKYLPFPAWQDFSPEKLLGVLLSAALLSLGAPFWYDTLKTTLKLRSTLADADDAQRLIRQTTQSPGASTDESAGSGATAPATPPLTEAGDLNAVG